MRNERRMLGSVRGCGKPVVERPYGARSLLYRRDRGGADRSILLYVRIGAAEETGTWREIGPASGPERQVQARIARPLVDKLNGPGSFLFLAHLIYSRQRPTFPQSHPCSIIGAGGLNYRVRDGNGCDPSAVVTGKRAARTRAKLYGNRNEVMKYDQAARSISISRLNASLHLHH